MAVPECSNCVYSDVRTRAPGVPYLACLKNAPAVVSNDVVQTSDTQWPSVDPDDWCGEYSPFDPLMYFQQLGYDNTINFLRDTTSILGNAPWTAFTFQVPRSLSCIVTARATYIDIFTGRGGTQELLSVATTTAGGSLTVVNGTITTIGNATMIGSVITAPQGIGSNVNIGSTAGSEPTTSVLLSFYMLMDWRSHPPAFF